MNATVRCPVCATQAAADSPACAICGAHLLVPLQGYCAACHAIVPADRAGACGRCGRPVADLRPQAGAAPEPVVAPPVPAAAPADGPAAAPSPAVSAAEGPAVAPRAPALPPIGASPGRLVIEGPVPRPSPRPAGSRLLLGCGVGLAVVVVLGVALGIAFLATGGAEMLKPVEPVTFDSVGQYPEHRRVVLTGRLRLPGRMHCDDDCGVFLVDPADPDREIGLFIDVPRPGGTAGPNQMDRMPALYETEEFRVHLDDGGVVGNGALVRVTGGVCRTVEKRDLCLTSDVIQRGS